MPKWTITARAKQWAQGTVLLSMPPFTECERVLRIQIARSVTRLMQEAYQRGRDDEAQIRVLRRGQRSSDGQEPATTDPFNGKENTVKESEAKNG